MKKKIPIPIIVLVILGVTALVFYFTPIKDIVTSTLPAQNQSKERVTSKRNTTCRTPDECNALQATNIAVAISAVQAYINDPKIKLSVRQDTIKKQVIVFCSKDNKCWGYDSKTKKVTEK